MSQLLQSRIGKGIKPDEFIASMTQNKQKFLDWYNQFAWEDTEAQVFFHELRGRGNLHCFILAADWCGDVVRNIPVVFQVLKEAGIPTDVLIKEQNEDVMDQFLTLGGRSIPIVIFADESGEILGKWGPRPKHVQEAMIEFKRGNPDRSAPDYEDNLRATYSEMMKRYGQGTEYQQIIVQKLKELLSSF